MWWIDQLLCFSLWDSIALNLITVNVDSVQEFPTGGEGPNQSSNHMINWSKSTNSNVTQQSSIINDPEDEVAKNQDRWS